MANLQRGDLTALRRGRTGDPAASSSLPAEAYTDPRWFEAEQASILRRSWRWLCHGESTREPGSYVAAEIAGRPIVVVRGDDGTLRGFDNVCKHRAHHLVEGRGTAAALTCPYHAWVYSLDGSLRSARHTNHLTDFDVGTICLDQIAVTEFGGMIYVNLDVDAAPLPEVANGLEAEILDWAPDVHDLTFAHRLTYEIKANWKTVIDNFLECYHCHVAHRDFVSLVDMDTYVVTTHDTWSSHMAEAGTSANSAYDVADATVTDHAVWWMWPTTCLMRYPGRGNLIVLNVIPVGAGLTHETYDFFLETAEPNEAERDAIRYLDEVLQPEDIGLCESVHRGMSTPSFDQGRLVVDPGGSGLSEHALHHFHGLVLEAHEQHLRFD